MAKVSLVDVERRMVCDNPDDCGKVCHCGALMETHPLYDTHMPVAMLCDSCHKRENTGRGVVVSDPKEHTPQDDLEEAPELGDEFFKNAVLTQPGESLLDLKLKCPSCGSDPDVDCICKGQNR